MIYFTGLGGCTADPGINRGREQGARGRNGLFFDLYLCPGRVSSTLQERVITFTCIGCFVVA